MKKNILTGAVLMALSFTSYAQNTVSVNQAGSNQTVKATQKGNLQSATISQAQGNFYNEENLADITQTGYGANTVVVSQNDGSQYNRSIISQKNGLGNTATIEQNAASDNTGKIEQEGNYNQGTIKQNNNSGLVWATISQGLSSNYNTASVEQSNRSIFNEVSIVQQGGNQGAGNEARVEQNGSTSRESEWNRATIIQSNLGNKTLITQNALLDRGSYNNKAYSTQEGTNGSVIITQNTTAVIENNITTVNQTATSVNSKATVEQATPYGGSIVNILQTGTGETTIYQLGSSYNTATVRQTDGFIDKNIATINQNATESWASISQSGNKNVGTITQNSFGAGAFIIQSSNPDNTNNQATILQTGVGSPYSGSYVEIYQGTATQSATDSRATVTQASGEGNLVRLLQTGNNEMATVFQTGYNNSLFGTPGHEDTAQQSGANNRLSVTQTSTGGPDLPGNSAYALQSGVGNTITIIQSNN